ncbi:outer membrane scaffolding protein for murein synthesis (MipA/OmpV family) [Rhizobium sp. BK251]|nr:outer membrane scaffolding protein for murein synthesis (MipA/OmpV family) [Rhizobium sp. BK251]
MHIRYRLPGRSIAASRLLDFAFSPHMMAGLMAMLLAGATQVQAQEATTTAPATQPRQPSQWIITLGGSVEYSPDYEGSKHYSVSGLPNFDIRRLGEPAEQDVPDDNFDLTVFTYKGIELGPVWGIRSGRSSFDDWRLEGLNRIDWSLDAGIFVQYWPIEDRLRLRAEARQALWNGGGLVADLAADWFQPITDGLVVSVGPRLTLGNSTFMSQNFGVSANEATKSRFPEFDAGGGVKSVGVTVAATYTINPQWSVQVYNRYDRLVSDAADSPITSQIGSKNQNIVGFTLNRSFQIGF